MKKRWINAAAALCFLLAAAGAGVFLYLRREDRAVSSVQMLTVDRKENPVGVNPDDVVFGWQMYSTENGKKQSAYRIVVAGTKKDLERKEYLWDSGRVETNVSAYIPYEGEALDHSMRYYWNVQVWDENGKLIKETEPACFDTCAGEDSWQDIKWISAPAASVQETEAEEFHISYQTCMKYGRASFIWGADQGEYGKKYRMELDTSEEFVICRVLFEDKKQVVWQEETKLERKSEEFVLQDVAVDIYVEQDQVSVHLDGEEAFRCGIDGCTLQGYGFYQDRSGITVYFDDLAIEDSRGRSLVQEDFEDPEHTVFAPYHITVEDGRLKVRHQSVLAQIQDSPAPLFRQEFTIEKEVERAWLYAASVGIYEPYLNGEKIGDRYFASGRQAFREEIKYDSYEVTDSLKEGKNVIGFSLGHGWYDRGGYSHTGNLGVKAQLVIRYTDGSTQVIGTDESWQCYTDGPVRNDDMYNGEIYDAAKEQEGWNQPDFDAGGWRNAACDIIDEPDMELVPNRMEGVACIETLAPISRTEPEEGVYVFDFGQEFTGIVSLSELKGKSGDCVTILYGEALNEENLSGKDGADGTVWRDNLLMAQNADYYIMDGDTGAYTPSFVCRAFRYVQIEGLSEPLEPTNIKAYVLSGIKKETGSFTTSNEDLNQLYENILWTQRSNYLDIPSDCPQRDERLGWSGDAQIFARSGAYNGDLYHFMDNYLYYLRESQNEEGAYADIVPNRECGYGNNGWADAGITITWYHYLQYGDKRIILDNYEAMRRYVDYLVNTSEEFIRTRQAYGDHNPISDTPQEVTNTALCAYVSGLLGKMADEIGEKEDAAYFEEIYNKYKSAWQKAFVKENGSIECWTQTAYTLGLTFDLFDEKRQMAAEHLSTCVSYTENHLNTGYIGTQFVLPALSDNGMSEQAYTVLEQTTYPSWLYMVRSGGTTVYERWNSYEEQEDGTYFLQGSLNHCGLGSVNEFLFRYVLGIEADENEPGFQHFILQPTIGGSLTYAKGHYESIYGTIISEWERAEDGSVTYHAVIPANTSASLIFPNGETRELESGEHTIQFGDKTAAE